MGSITMAARMLDAAFELAERGSRSTAFRRRSISTAYYAVFHAIDKLCADYVTHSAPRSSEEYKRAYRALDHGPLKNAFSQSPLKDVPRLRKIGLAIVTLQTERHKADYMPPIAGLFTNDRAKELINLAKKTIAEIESINLRHKDCRILATSLLFKERKQ